MSLNKGHHLFRRSQPLIIRCGGETALRRLSDLQRQPRQLPHREQLVAAAALGLEAPKRVHMGRGPFIAFVSRGKEYIRPRLVLRKRQDQPSAHRLICRQKPRVNQNTGKNAFFFQRTPAVMKPSRVHEQYVSSPQRDPRAVHGIVHFPFEDVNEFQIFMPVAVRPVIRKIRQDAPADV